MPYQPYTDIFILNVGRGSCAIVAHPSGRHSMVDINNGGELREEERSLLLSEGVATRLSALERELADPIDWFSEHFGTGLWRFILSHPDEDHMSGLRCILLQRLIQAENFWDLPHDKKHSGRDDFRTQEAYEDWLAYVAMRAGVDLETPGFYWPRQIKPERGDSRDYWNVDDIDVLSPTHSFVSTSNETEDWNNMSFVLRFRHGERSLLLPGDVEQAGWDDLAASGLDLAADVLVASHHGRKSGYPDKGVIDAINPSAVILSADRLKPEHDAAPKYRNKIGRVFSTRTHGTIQIRMHDDGKVEIVGEEESLATLNAPGFWSGFLYGA